MNERNNFLDVRYTSDMFKNCKQLEHQIEQKYSKIKSEISILMGLHDRDISRRLHVSKKIPAEIEKYIIFPKEYWRIKYFHEELVELCRILKRSLDESKIKIEENLKTDNNDYNDSLMLTDLIGKLNNDLKDSKKIVEILWSKFDPLKVIEPMREQLVKLNTFRTSLSKLLDSLSQTIEITEPINKDLLGKYSFHPNGQKQGEIIIFAIPIQLFAEKFELDPIKMAEIVLIHEIVHLISHCGLDTSQRRWTSRDYADADDLICEGIAQYYTLRYAKKHNLMREFGTLLDNQSKTYRRFKHDFAEQKLDDVRTAIINCRRNHTREYKQFLKYFK